MSGNVQVHLPDVWFFLRSIPARDFQMQLDLMHCKTTDPIMEEKDISGKPDDELEEEILSKIRQREAENEALRKILDYLNQSTGNEHKE